MKPLNDLDHLIGEYASGLTPPRSDGDAFDTRARIHSLALAPGDAATVPTDLDFLSKRLEISKKLLLTYTLTGRRLSSEVLDDPEWLSLTVALLTRAALTSTGAAPATRIRRFNALFKAIDLENPDWLDAPDGWADDIESAFQALLSELPATEPEPVITGLTDQSSSGESREIPLTVLFYEGPIARAYLETIRTLGLKPRRIIELVPSRDIVSKRPLGRWMPAQWRLTYSAFQLRNRIHYWPRLLQRKYLAMLSAIDSTIETGLGFGRTTLQAARSLRPLSHYSDDVSPALMDGLRDPNLKSLLESEGSTPMLFTGGGIVPASLFSIPTLKMLHVHPGYLPDIRGADCALWSWLLHGHFSASCFIMASGIDSGDIIESCWLPNLDFKSGPFKNDLRTSYRAVYAFIDPWIRSFVLKRLLLAHDRFDGLEAQPQKDSDGVTFHFMHDRIRSEVLGRIMANNP